MEIQGVLSRQMFWYSTKHGDKEFGNRWYPDISCHNISEDGNMHVQKRLRDPLPTSNSPIFASLYEINTNIKGKEATMKADTNILQRLITAFQAGRIVDLQEILQHNLMSVPIPRANTNGTLQQSRPGWCNSKRCIVICPPYITIGGIWCLVIDGKVLVVALGNPAGVANFGELADAFLNWCFRWVDVSIGFTLPVINTAKFQLKVIPGRNAQNTRVSDE